MDQMRALVVDDEEDFVETLLRRLEGRAIEASGARSGKEALDLLNARDFDVVVLDIRMPNMDGIEVLREIKKRKPLTEVILLTGHASVESGLQGMQLGAFDYVMKPVSLGELLDKMRQAHERKTTLGKK